MFFKRRVAFVIFLSLVTRYPCVYADSAFNKSNPFSLLRAGLEQGQSSKEVELALKKSNKIYISDGLDMNPVPGIFRTIGYDDFILGAKCHVILSFTLKGRRLYAYWIHWESAPIMENLKDVISSEAGAGIEENHNSFIWENVSGNNIKLRLNSGDGVTHLMVGSKTSDY